MPANPLKRLARRKEPTPVRPASRTPRTPRYGVVTSGRSRGRGRADARRERRSEREPGFLARVVNSWWSRLISAGFGGRSSR